MLPVWASGFKLSMNIPSPRIYPDHLVFTPFRHAILAKASAPVVTLPSALHIGNFTGSTTDYRIYERQLLGHLR